MVILGIDYGRAKVGLAISHNGFLAEPLITLRGGEGLVERLTKIIEANNVRYLILGLPEGELRGEIDKFGVSIAQKTKVPLEYFDETLSSQEAREKLAGSSIPKMKRKRLEHSAAAAVVLQLWLDIYGRNLAAKNL